MVAKVGMKNDQATNLKLRDRLMLMRAEAVPALILGLKYPAGFAPKRDVILQCLAFSASKQAAPFVASVLRDPVVYVADRACEALARIKDPETLPASRYYHDHLLSTIAANKLPASAGPADRLIARSAATRLILGDKTARSELIQLLLSKDLRARQAAHEALTSTYDERHDYDPEGSPSSRRQAVRGWLE